MYRNSVFEELENHLNSWVGSISGNSKNLILVDTSFYKIEDFHFFHMLGRVLEAFQIQNVNICTQTISDEQLSALQKHTSCHFVVQEIPPQSETILIAMDGNGFRITTSFAQRIQSGHGETHFLSKEEVLELMEKLL